jgi:formate/nitrite transporter
VLKIAVSKTSLGFTPALVRGIFCNWLVCLAVWMAFAGKDVISKIFGIFFPIMLFVASNFEHSVANMYYIPAGILAKSLPAAVEASKLGVQVNILTWRNFLVVNLLPVTIGNIIGAGVFVACFYWFAYLRGTAPQAVKAAPDGKAATATAGK